MNYCVLSFRKQKISSVGVEVIKYVTHFSQMNLMTHGTWLYSSTNFFSQLDTFNSFTSMSQFKTLPCVRDFCLYLELAFWKIKFKTFSLFKRLVLFTKFFTFFYELVADTNNSRI